MKLLLVILFSGISAIAGAQQRFVFYLHGMIVELQGADAVDNMNGYGAYKYRDILDSFRHKYGFTVISEVRQKNTDVKEYARKVVAQVDSLLKKKVSPENITVVGASKGSLIAMHVSSYLMNKRVNFVLMGVCIDDVLKRSPELSLYGNILSVNEKTDIPSGQPCNKFREKPAGNISHSKEIELNTGLRHGFLYKPLPAWMDPAAAWGRNGNYK